MSPRCEIGAFVFSAIVLLLFGVLMVEIFLSGGTTWEVVFCVMLVARCMLMWTLRCSCRCIFGLVCCVAVVGFVVGEFRSECGSW